MQFHQERLLEKGKIENLVDALRSSRYANPRGGRETSFRNPHLFVGSGMIEAGCTTGIGSRLNAQARSRSKCNPHPSQLSLQRPTGASPVHPYLSEEEVDLIIDACSAWR